MSDTQQTESGADVNALRNNFEVGESKTLKVLQYADDADGGYVINAEVEAGDGDKDKCIALEGFTPVVGEMAVFTRTEEGMTIGPVKTEEATEAVAEGMDTAEESK